LPLPRTWCPRYADYIPKADPLLAAQSVADLERAHRRTRRLPEPRLADGSPALERNYEIPVPSCASGPSVW